ncbi:cysteine proteinase [Laetiporus sulphureus 93-53]|uniref:Ubiquitin carboxyl-terminal hydrolase n=1 Tax=Laetiporus sulphureus 93-53 TaxID=1314785 RepID=A0A165G0T7_9APHY|nr:cysteine proteinase [Laetiporus sulphureus 93-53]KZT09678.1 cysteine proteinase [Laetiporus sulphureus 93-53]
MASPNSPYPIPGPSTYYHTPPPPQHQYGHAPGPASLYPYMPPINGHVPLHQPTSPRISPTSRGRYNTGRGGGIHGYQHYQHLPPTYGIPPTNMQSPPVSPVSPFTQPQKYTPHVPQIPYSPPYAHQTNGSYPPAWSAQPLSPLPKQLSMLPPTAPSQSAQFSHPSQPQVQSFPSASLSETIAQPSPALSHPSSPKPECPPATVVNQDTVPQDNVFHDIASTPDSPLPSSRSNSGQFVVWSRRPQDPSQAPGVIISSEAFPPEDVLQQALDLPTPPASPKLQATEASTQPTEPSSDAHHVPDEFHDESPEAADVTSSVTETSTSSTMGETPMPGSPASSHTSMSMQAASPSVDNASKVSPSSQVETQLISTTPSTAEGAPTPTTESTTSVTPAAPSADLQPASVSSPTTSQKAPLKKSWASLLQSTDAAASSSKTSLPVSSVVGISIPASALSSLSASTTVGAVVPAQQRSELLHILNKGPSTANVPLKIQPRGLINTGNTCFANAVLQILVYCQPFNKLFTDLSKYLTGPVVGSQKEGTKATPLIDAIVRFMKEFVPETSSDAKAKGKEREDDFYEPESFIPSYVYDAMKEKKRFASMIGGHQEDAEEFLGFFLDTLEEELLLLSDSLSPKRPKTNEPAEQEPSPDEGWYEVGKKNRPVMTRMVKSTESPITRIFGGKFRTTLRAPHQKDSATVEDWRSLRLDIQREQVHTIKDALQHISHPQPVQISQSTRPGVVVEATQQALVEALPPVLVLHLKRFLYDTNVGDVVKIGKQISYGPELEISPDLLTPAKRTPHPAKYQLFGVLYHHGQSASGGHYTLDVLHPNRDLSDRPRPAWIRIDDELVSDVRPEDVFGGMERDDRCAYLLFYRRLAGWGARP